MKKCGSCVATGLLVIRVALGVIMAIHGAMFVFGGQEMWSMAGTMGLDRLGITGQAAMIIGLIGSLIFFVGGILVALGLFTQAAAFAIAIVLLFAAIGHLARGDGFYSSTGARHAAELFFVYLGLAMTGAGKYSLDAKCCGMCEKK